MVRYNYPDKPKIAADWINKILARKANDSLEDLEQACQQLSAADSGLVNDPEVFRAAMRTLAAFAKEPVKLMQREIRADNLV